MIPPLDSCWFYPVLAVSSAALLVGCGGGESPPLTAGGGGSSGGGGAGAMIDGGVDACTITADAASCSTRPIVTITNGGDARRIYWNTPPGEAPSAGFPAVVLYQGSIYGPSLSWDVSLPISTQFGGYYQVALIARLLGAGFTVIQPEAQGGLAWNTNSSANYDASPDATFIPQLLDRMGDGTFGPIDTSHLYATGISSGGYMTSRMAVSYAGRFRALAIQSGSYATCLGPLCTIPPTLPVDHPPTLLLHGDADTIVPISTAKAYYDALVTAGIEAEFVNDPAAGHQWLASAPNDVTNWFSTH
jgi:poly(3-hydroxyoctanoate) depolymerase